MTAGFRFTRSQVLKANLSSPSYLTCTLFSKMGWAGMMEVVIKAEDSGDLIGVTNLQHGVFL